MIKIIKLLHDIVEISTNYFAIYYSHYKKK